MEIVRTEDTGTLRHDVYFNDDESECIVVERYRDAAALIGHAEHLGDLPEPGAGLREPPAARKRPTGNGAHDAAVSSVLTSSRGTVMALKNRYTFAALLAALALSLVALAGCGTTATTATTTQGGTVANTVTASGMGTTQAAPDTAEMYFGVTTTSANAQTALDDASKVAEQIAAAVKKEGIAAEDIQTRDVSVYPQTTDQDGKQVITGYQASLGVQVKVRDIAELGAVISAANAAGANSISGPTFTIDDPAPFRATAIDEAVADARKSAEAMAAAAGKSVGEVLSMSSSDVGLVPSAMYGASDMAGAAKDVPIEPGQLDISANVVVVFELK